MKNISLKHITFVVVATTFLSTYVSASESSSNTLISVESTAIHNANFSQLDLNKDGLISQVEAEKNSQLNKIFAKVDTNGDATISEDEFTAFLNSIK